jgi:hypothetical protein
LLAAFQRNEVGAWVFQYEFNAETADPALAGLNYHATSPEPFEYEGFLYIAFVVADAPDFGSATRGNIMLTRVESDDPTPEDHHFRILNTLDDVIPPLTTVPMRKRNEPEIHFLLNANPAVYYTWVAGANDANCAAQEHKLMRAVTGPLWDD